MYDEFNFNKGMTSPLVTTIIIVVAFFVIGGVIGYQYFIPQKEVQMVETETQEGQEEQEEVKKPVEFKDCGTIHLSSADLQELDKLDENLKKYDGLTCMGENIIGLDSCNNAKMIMRSTKIENVVLRMEKSDTQKCIFRKEYPKLSDFKIDLGRERAGQIVECPMDSVISFMEIEQPTLYELNTTPGRKFFSFLVALSGLFERDQNQLSKRGCKKIYPPLTEDYFEMSFEIADEYKEDFEFFKEFITKEQYEEILLFSSLDDEMIEVFGAGMIIEAAEERRDPELCKRIEKDEFRSDCLVGVAGLSKDESICDMLDKDLQKPGYYELSYLDSCYSRLDLCDKISVLNWRDNCYQNEGECDKITTQRYLDDIDNCYLYSRQCEKIKDSVQKESCEEAKRVEGF